MRKDFRKSSEESYLRVKKVKYPIAIPLLIVKGKKNPFFISICSPKFKFFSKNAIKIGDWFEM